MAIKMISLSDELKERLAKEDNASKLISGLLEDYYKKHDTKMMTIEEKKKHLQVLKAKIEFKNKLKEIEHG